MSKKCYDWDSHTFIQATCPYCKKDVEMHSYISDGCVGDSIVCPECHHTFVLGEQK